MKRVVVITGGAGGIGQACVKKFIEKDEVIILDVNKKAVDQCINNYGVDGYVIDLCDIESIREVILKIVHKYTKIDVLIQTAGIMEGCPALELDSHSFENMMRINVEGMFFVMQEVVKHSMYSRGGIILNFASEAAIRGYKGPMAAVHYSASKGAVIAMSRQLSVEWGQYNIRVNSISPGGVLTPAMAALSFEEDLSNIPLGKLSTPMDIAETVAFVCSEEAKMIAGQNIVVDGGCAAVGC